MKKQITWFLLGIILVIASVVRFYHFRDHLTFQSDQGRDAIIAKQILKDGDIALIGPVTSVGNMYLGPFYYYFMVPFLFLTYPDPSGPAYAIAFSSLITVFLIYIVGKKLFNTTTALIAAALFSVMGSAVTYSRFSWNPNIAPLLGILLCYAVYLAYVKHKLWWWLLVSLCFSLLLQSHYVYLAAAPALLALYIHSRKAFKSTQHWLRMGLLSAFIILITFTPLIVFDIRHDGLISKGFGAFFTSNEEHLRPFTKVTQTIQDLELRSWLVLAQFMGSSNVWSNRIMVAAALLGSAFVLKKRISNSQQRKSFLFITLFLLSAILTTAFYTSTVFEHYLLYLLPFVALFYGYLIHLLVRTFPLGLRVILITIIFVGFSYINLASLPFWKAQTPALDLYQQAMEDTLVHLPPGKYNFLLVSNQRDYYGLNYRYFFETSNRKPAASDDYRDLNYLVVIDELNLDNPLAVNAFEMLIAGPKQVINQFKTNLNTSIWIYEIVDDTNPN